MLPHFFGNRICCEVKKKANEFEDVNLYRPSGDALPKPLQATNQFPPRRPDIISNLSGTKFVINFLIVFVFICVCVCVCCRNV